MRHSGDYVDELLSEVDDLFPDNEILQSIWETYDEKGYLSDKALRTLERMRARGQAA
ncbi:MAG: hypothetical protein KC910_29805 [Candidatus Eremiobacteraeota bacterium]|nr:hypothetical protein [Candidatus Eremiobacteraeota bacterium]